MRVWDINPGYLNRESLLGEHREIHAIASIITNQKKGYSNHPETMRWKKRILALKQRHNIVVSEMALRGYKHNTPIKKNGKVIFQTEYVDSPANQFYILKEKYINKESGRIPLPKTPQQLWAQHKYSVLARDPAYYRKVGKFVSNHNDKDSFEKLAFEFVEILKFPPQEGRLLNALLHIWGYISDFAKEEGIKAKNDNVIFLITNVRQLAIKYNVRYLMESTILNEFTNMK